MTQTRLSPDRWIKAGLDALRAHGPHALAAEPLARQLGSTKGSFYWHFKDVPAYQQALLRHWQAAALADIMGLLASDGAVDQRLRRFGECVLADPVEPALRHWAHGPAAEVLAVVDAERLRYLQHLLAQQGLRNPDFAHALLACLIGLPQLSGDKTAAFDSLVDTILALS
ncbi:MAG: TetR/AcrR family transcriptional regulator [Sulfitobacter sp.]